MKALSVEQLRKIIKKHVSTFGERYGAFGYLSVRIDTQGAAKEIYRELNKGRKHARKKDSKSRI